MNLCGDGREIILQVWGIRVFWQELICKSLHIPDVGMVGQYSDSCVRI